MQKDDHTLWLLRHLEALATQLGVEIRYESLVSKNEELSLKSGFCKLNKRQLIIVDTSLSKEKQCRILASELRRFDLSAIYVIPAIRNLIEG